MFPGLAIEGVSRQHVQDFINDRVVAQGKAKRTVVKQVCGIRSYWSHLCSVDESLRDRRPFAELIWPKPNRPSPPHWQLIRAETSSVCKHEPR
jgi:site-specific recombinase XerD